MLGFKQFVAEDRRREGELLRIFRICGKELHYYGSKISMKLRSSNYSSRSSNEKNERRSEVGNCPQTNEFASMGSVS